MLSNLASYLMGGSTTVHSANTHGPSEIAQGVVLAPQELRCTEDEDWLVVDPESRQPNSVNHGGSSMSYEASSAITINDSRGCRELPDDYLADGGDSADSENCVPSSGLEESWYVAPAACIARRKPQQLATSPLENLLIEHPSMSVYHHSITEESASSPTPISIIEEEDDEDMMDLEMKKSRQSVSSEKPHRCYLTRSKDLTATATPTVPHLKSQKVSLEAAMLGGRVTQKRDRQSNRSQLDRLNKNRTSPGQQKLRRSDRQHSSKNSNANNNRKCSQRMF
ncbi:tumor protein p53-inducible nuclear protein 2 [Galendromus occidentalis]|uniref:Tumor protein p53-inducible nuclear protein 2 n=1 Tax=Galendromus occidentalis TaxID=34638 RepID=A0AAJ7L6Y9_9ACAR|nr:tumor protein p53-inducible nuclear protein 2 [Galendromus occidentalis]